MKITSACAFCSAALVRKTAMSMYFCDKSCKAAWQRTQKPLTESELRAMYVDQKLDCTQIAAVVKRDPKSVWSWLKGFGIETRKRGTTGNHVHSIGVPRVLTDAGRKALSDNARAARMKDGRKPYLMPDGSHAMKGRTGDAHPGWKGGLTPERQAFYASEEWAEAVKAVWKRDQAVCRRCGVHHNTTESRGTFHIHHIVSFQVAALRSAAGNLALLCAACHRHVHSRKNTTKEFLA